MDTKRHDLRLLRSSKVLYESTFYEGATTVKQSKTGRPLPSLRTIRDTTSGHVYDVHHLRYTNNLLPHFSINSLISWTSHQVYFVKPSYLLFLQ